MSKSEATRLADALDKAARCEGTYSEWAVAFQGASVKLRQWPGGEPVCYQYLFDSPFGGEVWCDSPNNCNGNKPKASRALYTAPPDSAARIADMHAAYAHSQQQFLDSAARIAELEANTTRANAAMQEVERVVTHLIAKEAALTATLKVAGEALKDVLEEAKWSTDSEWEKDRAAKALQQIKEAQR